MDRLNKAVPPIVGILPYKPVLVWVLIVAHVLTKVKPFKREQSGPSRVSRNRPVARYPFHMEPFDVGGVWFGPCSFCFSCSGRKEARTYFRPA